MVGLWPLRIVRAGANFGPLGAAAVTIGGVSCVLQPAQSRHNSLVCVTQLCFGPLTVTVAGQQRATTQYTYTALVRLADIVEVTPLSGPTSGGTVMSIIGNAFGTSGNVTLQEVALGSFAALGAPVPCTVEVYGRAEIRSVVFASFVLPLLPARYLRVYLCPVSTAGVRCLASCACNHVPVTQRADALDVCFCMLVHPGVSCPLARGWPTPSQSRPPATWSLSRSHGPRGAMTHPPSHL